MKQLVSAVQARARCGALFIFHSPHHANRAAGSYQWEATVDATLVLRRRFAAAPKPSESPDDDAESTTEDGRRVLMGTTRWGGQMKMSLSFASGQYQIGTSGAPLIDRVRWFLQDTPAGPERTSATAMTRALSARTQAVTDAIHLCIERGEARYVGTGRKRYIEPTASLSFYAQERVEANGKSAAPPGESMQEEKDSGELVDEILSLPEITPRYESGKGKKSV